MVENKIDMNNITYDRSSRYTTKSSPVVKYKGSDGVVYILAIWDTTPSNEKDYWCYLQIRYGKKTMCYNNKNRAFWNIPNSRKHIVDELLQIFDSYYLVNLLI